MSDNVTRVYRHNRFLDYTHDVTTAVSNRDPSALRDGLRIPIADNMVAGLAPEAEPTASFEVATLHIPYEKYVISKRREHLVKTEHWGDEVVEYWEYWFDHIQWLAPKSEDAELR